MPNLREVKYITHSRLFNNVTSKLKEIDFSNFEGISEEGLQDNYSVFSNLKFESLRLPKLFKINVILDATSICEQLELGNGMRDGVAGNIKVVGSTNTYLNLTTLTVAEGFKAKLNLTGCNGLARETLLGIINNLADLKGETSLNLIMGSTLLAKLTDADKAIAQQKNWTLS